MELTAEQRNLPKEAEGASPRDWLVEYWETLPPLELQQELRWFVEGLRDEQIIRAYNFVMRETGFFNEETL